MSPFAGLLHRASSLRERARGMRPARARLGVVLAGVVLCAVLHPLPGLAVSERPFEVEHGPPALAEVTALLRDGRWNDAVARGEEVLAETEDTQGPGSLATALVLDRLVEAMWRAGQGGEPRAQELAERALAIEERVLGPDHPELGTCLQVYGNLLSRRGDFEASRVLHQRSLDIWEAAYGPTHESVAGALNDLGIVIGRSGDFLTALECHQRALAIREDVHPPGHAKIALSHANLGWIHMSLATYEESIEHSQAALGMITPEKPSSHPMVLGLRFNLASGALQLGDYDEARSAFEELLGAIEESIGPDHHQVSEVLYNLAVCARLGGNYDLARGYIERATEILRQTYGPDHYELCHGMSLLGDVHAVLGDPTRADDAYVEALRIAELAHGPDHSFVASVLRARAEVHVQEGRLDLARAALERALAIAETRSGEGPAGLGGAHEGLRDLAVREGNLNAALHHAREAHLAYQKGQGEVTMYTVTSLQGLARAEGRLGLVDSAAVHFDEALRALLELFGESHPLVAETLLDLARLDGAPPAEAFDAALRAEAIAREHQRLLTRALPESEALRFAAVRTSGRDLALSLVLGNETRVSGEPVARVYDTVIRSRAVVLDEMGARHRRTHGSRDPELPALRERERRARARLANLVLRSQEDIDPTHHRRLLDDARQDRDDAERAVAEARGTTTDAAADPGLEELRQSLGDDHALVSYVRFRRSAVDPDTATATAGYGAFVLSPSGTVSLTWLGPAHEVEAEVRAWREQVTIAPPPGEDLAAAEARADAAGAALAARVWTPLTTALDGATRSVVVPDGLLHLTNFLALPVEPGRYLVEEPLLVHVTSAERDLVRTHDAPRGHGLMAFGAPAYDADCLGLSADLALVDVPEGRPSEAAPYRGSAPGCSSFQSVRFPPLPDSGAEVAEIVRLWTSNRAAGTATAVVGAAANEAAFKALAPGHRVLHLATHGFFVDEGCASASDTPGQSAVRGVGGLRPAVGGTRSHETRMENPLVRSGLVLAGANTRSTTPNEAEDGLLTAEEIAALDLTGVEWAVLSACETGLGQLHDAEGVLGLRRAFQVAGARTVVMSLWPISDEAAREWMADLYLARLNGGASTAEAVRDAARAALARRRAAGESDHPHGWAGFLASGDWR